MSLSYTVVLVPENNENQYCDPDNEIHCLLMVAVALPAMVAVHPFAHGFQGSHQPFALASKGGRAVGTVEAASENCP